MLPSIFELTGGAIATLGRIVSDRRGMFDALKRLRRDQPPRSRFGERGSSFGSGRMRFKPARSPKGQSEQ